MPSWHPTPHVTVLLYRSNSSILTTPQYSYSHTTTPNTPTGQHSHSPPTTSLFFFLLYFLRILTLQFSFFLINNLTWYGVYLLIFFPRLLTQSIYLSSINYPSFSTNFHFLIFLSFSPFPTSPTMTHSPLSLFQNPFPCLLPPPNNSLSSFSTPLSCHLPSSSSSSSLSSLSPSLNLLAVRSLSPHFFLNNNKTNNCRPYSIISLFLQDFTLTAVVLPQFSTTDIDGYRIRIISP